MLNNCQKELSNVPNCLGKLPLLRNNLASVPNIFRTFNQTNKSSNMFWEELLTLKNIEQLHNMEPNSVPNCFRMRPGNKLQSVPNIFRNEEYMLRGMNQSSYMLWEVFPIVLGRDLYSEISYKVFPTYLGMKNIF